VWNKTSHWAIDEKKGWAVPEKVYIVIVNWNGWRDTIECLESVFRIEYPDYQVIVCDNASADGSLDHIKEWAAGHLCAPASANRMLRDLVTPSVRKPIPFVEYDRRTAEAGGHAEDTDTPLILVDAGANLGFAGGCNVGLRYALARGDCAYAWLLNNDTVITPDALTALVSRMQERPDAGQCGSRLLFYDDPTLVQAFGGARYNRWLALATHIGAWTPAHQPADTQDIESRMDYVIGASLLVSRSFLLDVGLLEESYFLYNEEIDWATRANGRYRIAYAHDSIVYHKEGRAIGSSSSAAQKSRLADFYGIRNRLQFTRAHHPLALPIVYLGLILAIANRLRRHQPERALDILRIMFSPRRHLSGAGR
jgi:GT2 family glycosyltransferase